MKEELIKQEIDLLINDLIENLKQELSQCLENITLTGTYTIEDISFNRPNINIIIFLKKSTNAKDYLKLGEVFYKTAKQHLNLFRIRIDMLPFRFASPIGDKELEVIITPLILNMAQKNQKPAFGIPLNVLEGMNSMGKVVFGTNVLSSINFDYSREDFIRWAFFDLGVLYKNQLIRVPLTYDINENLDLLVTEALEIGKVALYWGTEIFLNDKHKSFDLIKNKDKMIDFYQNISQKLGNASKIILEARNHFQEYKVNKDKAFRLYEAAYTAITEVFFKVLSEMRK